MRCCGGEADVLQTQLQILQYINCKMHHNVLGKISCDKLKQKLMDIEFILNDALNKALITNRIKGVPSSNKIADFVSKYVESEQLILPVVSKRSEPFICKKGDYLTYIGGSNTKYLKKGDKYRTTWDGENLAGRIAVIGIDKKRLVLRSSFFTN